MSITTSPATFAGNSERPAMATDFLDDVVPLMPLYIAPVADAPFPDCFHTPPETLSAIAGYISDNVNDAREAVEKAENYLSLGAAYFRADDLVFIVEARNSAIKTLDAVEEIHRAFSYGRPKSWFIAHAAQIGLLRDVLVSRYPDRFSDGTVEDLLDALIEA